MAQAEPHPPTEPRPSTEPRPTLSRWAIACLVMRGDGYVPGALAMGFSARRASTAADLVCMVRRDARDEVAGAAAVAPTDRHACPPPPRRSDPHAPSNQVTDDVSEAARSDLAVVFDRVQVVPYIRTLARALPTQKQQDRYGAWMDIACTKWNVLGLTDYEKVRPRGCGAAMACVFPNGARVSGRINRNYDASHGPVCARGAARFSLSTPTRLSSVRSTSCLTCAHPPPRFRRRGRCHTSRSASAPRALPTRTRTSATETVSQTRSSRKASGTLLSRSAPASCFRRHALTSSSCVASCTATTARPRPQHHRPAARQV